MSATLSCESLEPRAKEGPEKAGLDEKNTS